MTPACSTDAPAEDGGTSGTGTSAGASGVTGQGGAGGSTAGSTVTAGVAGSSSSKGGNAGMSTGGIGNGTAGVSTAGTDTAGAAGASSSTTGAGGSGAGAGGGGQGGAGQGGSAGTEVAGTTSSGGSGAVGGSGGSGSIIPHTGVWRIMALGDSITQSTCYPQLLSKKLKDAGHTNFELIGSTTNNQSCSGAPNVQTEGHGGYILTCLTGDAGSTNCSGRGMPSELANWLAARPAPDVALILFGTNDVWNGIPVSSILTGYTDLVTGLREANPNVAIFLGRILPMFPDSSCCNDRVIELNASLVGWAANGTEASPIFIVPIYESVGDPNGFKAKTTDMDGVHPNEMAAGQMADAWMAALVPHGIGD